MYNNVNNDIKTVAVHLWIMTEQPSNWLSSNDSKISSTMCLSCYFGVFTFW